MHAKVQAEAPPGQPPHDFNLFELRIGGPIAIANAAAGCFALDASAVVFLSYLFCTWKLGKVIIIFASQRFLAEGMIWGKLLGGFVVKCKEPREQPFRYGMLMMHSWARSVEEGLLINQESSDSPRTYRVSK